MVSKQTACLGLLLMTLTAIPSAVEIRGQDPFVLGPGTQRTTGQPTSENPGSNALGGLPASTPVARPNDGTTNQPAGPMERVAANPNLERSATPQNLLPQNLLPQNRPPQNLPPNAGEQVIGEEFKPGRVVANVGGYPIFRGDVMADINQLIEANMAGAPEAIKDQQREMALPLAVDRAIEQKLLFVDAVRSLPEPDKLPDLRQTIGEQFAETRLPELMKNLKVNSPAEVEAKLRQLGTSLRQVRDSWVDGQLAGYFIRDKVNMNPEITHFEMLEYYNEHRKDYYFPARVRWEQIMIRFDRCDSREQAWERLGELGNEVVYGANFSAVARKSSHGFEAEKGGYNDWTTQGSLVHDAVDEALFTLPINQLSDRIESRIGFHIVRVIERKEAGYKPFSACQKEIREKILKQKQNGALQEYVDKLKQEIPYENYLSGASSSGSVSTR